MEEPAPPPKRARPGGGGHLADAAPPGGSAAGAEAANEERAAPSGAGGATCAGRRSVKTVGFLGISDYGLGQFKVLAGRYKVAFATAKAKRSKHAEGLDQQLEVLCRASGTEYLGSVDANSAEVVERSRQVDLVVIGGYDKILRSPILEAPKFGVLNTHLGVLPLNRGCCPTMWAQLHELPQGYTTYQVNCAIDHGEVLDRWSEPDERLGGLRDTNRAVYDALAARAVERFAAALDRFESGEPLSPCTGVDAYHRQGMPNGSWLSFHWRNAFLRRFSLALDFDPYLPGQALVVGRAEPVHLGVEAGIAEAAADFAPEWRAAQVGQVLAADGQAVLVRTREGAVRCSVRAGAAPEVGALLESRGGQSPHPIDAHFDGDALPLDPYIRTRGVDGAAAP